MTTRNLRTEKGSSVKNQFVITTNNATYFQSYQSVVAKVVNGKLVEVSRHWCYSNTTMRQLYRFLSQYANLSVHKAEIVQMLDNGTIRLQPTNSLTIV